jgi:hypothetical protein
MKKFMMAAAMTLAATTAAPALAVTTLTFEGQANTIYNAPIVRSGFTVGNPAAQEQHFHEIDSTQFGLASNGTGVLLNDRDTEIFLSKVGGGTFTLTSFDVASALNNNPAAGITIKGYLASVLTGTITISNLFGFQNAVGSALGSVDYVVFDGTGGEGGFELDNIVLDGAVVPGAVPESSTWLMMLAGFGLVGSTMRRRVTYTKRSLV